MYLLSMLPKFFLALFILLLYVKLSGKSQIAPMSQLDQVGSMVIGALVGGALLSPTVSTWEAIGVIVVWSSLLVAIRFIKSKNAKLRDIIDGRPIELVKNGHLLSNNFLKANLPVRDFEALVNVQGISSFNELQHVWYELNGSLTIIKKGDKDIASLFVEDGAINSDNLKQAKKSETWLKKALKDQGYDDVTNVFCAEWYDNKLWVYPKDDINALNADSDDTKPSKKRTRKSSSKSSKKSVEK